MTSAATKQMKRNAIWKIALCTTPEAEDAVTELFSTVFGEPASAYADAETGTVTVAAYCQTKPPGIAGEQTALSAGISRIRDCGLNVGQGRVSVRRIRREDWAESWKRHFKTITVGRSLLIKPSWVNRRARKGQAVVVIDPGLSFGTGHHPTTLFCLGELAKRRRAGEAQSLLDIGTGSGILAISAAKLGYSPVHAFDFDSEVVRVARSNARLNSLSRRIQFKQVDLTKLPDRPVQRFSLICANLVSTLLIAEREKVARLLRPDGVLVLAGILKSEFLQVRTAYESVGLCVMASRSEKGWRSGTFVHSHSRYQPRARH